MPLNNAVITTAELTGTEGTISTAGVVNLTITPELGYTLFNNDGSINAFIGGGATEINPNEWVGGNVTAGVEKVIFSNNGDNTVNAAVHYSAIDWSNATDLYVDIDGKANQVFVDDGSEFSDSINGNGDTPDCCDNFVPVIESVTHSTGEDVADGSIQATGAGGSSDYTFSVQPYYSAGEDETEYVNPFGLVSGDYFVHVVDNGCGCEGTEIVTINYEASSNYNNHGVHVLDVGSKYFDKEILPTASSKPLLIKHGLDAHFEIEIVNKGTGEYYDFNTGSFHKRGAKRGDNSPTINKEIKYPNRKITKYTINFPSTSVNARYEVYINPLGRTMLHDSIPTKENPLYIWQRINNTITLALTTDESDSWGSLGTVAVTGRPHSKPGHVKEKGFNATTARSNAFTNVDFTLTATYDASGGKSPTLRGLGANAGHVSTASKSGTILSYDGKVTKMKDGFRPNDIGVSITSTAYSAPTLTVKGKLTINEFGSLSETINMNIDQFIPVA